MLKFHKLLLLYFATYSTPALTLDLRYLLVSPIVASAFNINPMFRFSQSNSANRHLKINPKRSPQKDFISFSFKDNTHIRFVNFHGSKLIVGINHHTPFDELFASISASSDPRYTMWDSEDKWILSFEYCKKLTIFEMRLILDALKFDSFIDHETHEMCLERIN